MSKILNFLEKYWHVLFLVALVILIGYTNPLPAGGWLTGWDNLHSEFWPQMNIQRSLSAVWQEYQGLGLLGGMGHAADLFREGLLWLGGMVLPTNWLRYGYHLAMYLLGMVGTYLLLEKVVLKRYPENVRRLAGVVGALFYAFNLGTILYFYAPFEPYSTFWGVLPWEIYSLICYLEKPSKNNLIWLFVINILGVAQGYVQTLFLIYALCIGIIVVGNIIAERTWRSIKHGVVAGMLIVLTNTFWILPAAYYVKTSVNEHNNSAQISFATEMFYLMNQGRGKLSDFISMKLFYYDFTDWNTDGTGFDYFVPAWVKYYQDPLIVGITYVFVVIGIIGIFSKSRFKMQFGLVFLLGLIGFLSAEKGISQLNELMRQNELFAQLFRNPYTKLIVPTVLSMSMFIGSGFAIVMNIKYFKHVMFAIGVGMALMLARPVWQGEFFYKAERITIPDAYMELFDFMKNKADPAGRIALLPAHYIWGWANHEWGYRGSGFLWYGIKQPILDRAFDVWSEKNEGFYYEFSNAIYSGGETRLADVVRKYDVKYLLLDKSVVDAGFYKDVFAYDKSINLFIKLGYKRVLEQGMLSVWDTGIDTNQFVSVPASYTLVDGDTLKTRKDVIYEDVGTYVESDQPSIVYPFAGLMREEVKGVEYGESGLQLTANGIQRGSELMVPGWKVGEIVRVEYKDGESLPAYYVNGQAGPRFLGKEKPEAGKNIIYARISEAEEWKEYVQDFRFQTLDTSIKIEVPGEPQIYDFSTEGEGTTGNCDVLKRGNATKHAANGLQQTVYEADERGAACDYVAMKELDTRLSYLMRVQGENIEGRSLKFFLYNAGSKRNDIEYLLGKVRFDQTFALLPWAWDGYYTLNIETRSFGQRAENLIDPVEVRWFPLTQIAGAKIVDRRQTLDVSTVNNLKIVEVRKTGTWLYKVKVEGSGLLRLSQGYDQGWIAPPIQHVKVDGWANGWIISNSQIINSQISNEATEIYIFYWPQLLEYLGFGILGLTLIWLAKLRN